MKFAWDSAKSNANERDRGFDFAFAASIFGGPHLVTEDTRLDYGERRQVAIGMASGFHLTVVFTDRQGEDGELIRRIISARRSHQRERDRYDQTLAQGRPPAPGSG